MKNAFLVLANGGKYQTYIPEYIYFAETSYPNSDVIVYSNKKIRKKINSSLNLLRASGFRFKIIYYNLKDYGVSKINNLLNNQLNRCARWLICDDFLLNYDNVYIGDIDLLICRENNNLFSEHIKHCEFLGLPYSDIVRAQEDKKQLNKKCFSRIIKTFLRRGNSKNTLIFPRQTGLRMVKSKEYFPKIMDLKEKYISILSSYRQWNKSCLFNKSNFCDEMLLHSLMTDAFEKTPYPSKSVGGEVDANPLSFDFRPHHGIHLSLFSKGRNLSKKSSLLLKSDQYIEYYKYFLAMNTGLHKKLFKNFSKKHKQQIEKLLHIINNTKL